MPIPGGSRDSRDLDDDEESSTDVYQINADGTNVAPVQRTRSMDGVPAARANLKGSIVSGLVQPLSNQDTDPRIRQEDKEANTNPAVPIPRELAEKPLPWDEEADPVRTNPDPVRTERPKSAVDARAAAPPPSAQGRKATAAQMPAQVGAPAPRKPTRAEVPAAPAKPAPRKPTVGEFAAPGKVTTPNPTAAGGAGANPAMPRRNSRGEVLAVNPEVALRAAAPQAPAQAAPAASGDKARLQTPKPVVAQGRHPTRAAQADAIPVQKAPAAPKPPSNSPSAPGTPRMEDMSTNLYRSLEDGDGLSVTEPKSGTGSRKIADRLKSAARQFTSMRARLPSQMTGVMSLERSRRGAQMVIAVGMLSVGIAGVVYALVKHVEQPPLETLQILYPFGLTGRRMPNGRLAPPATEIRFSFRGVNDCGVDVCETFDGESRDKNFHLVMNVRKKDGDWVLDGTSAPGQ